MAVHNLLKRLQHRISPKSMPHESPQIRMFADAGLDWDQACRIANENVIKNQIPRTDPSNHYEIFAGISQVCNPTSILEIGTHRGVFTSFLAALWPNAKIITYELPMRESLPIAMTSESDLDRHYVSHFKSDAEFRDSMLSRFSNIELRLQDSSVLAEVAETFDVIWIDGDHRYPVVAFDAMNAVRLCNTGGWIGLDDIRLKVGRKKSISMGSTEGHESASRIAATGLTTLNLVLKRGQNAHGGQVFAEEKHIAILRKN